MPENISAIEKFGNELLKLHRKHYFSVLKMATKRGFVESGSYDTWRNALHKSPLEQNFNL